MRISCLMVTHNRQKSCFTRSFAAYCAQTYENKELVIVSHGDREYNSFLLDSIKQSGRTDVSVSFSPYNSLGILRNQTLDIAQGDIICQWDDDDLYHPDRLKAQFEALTVSGADVTFLSEHLHFFEDSRVASLWNWSAIIGEFALPGSLFGYKRVIPRYPEQLHKQEDSAVLNRMYHSGISVGLLLGLWHLYLYIYHGGNTYNRHHHYVLCVLCRASRSQLQDVCSVLPEVVSDYHLPFPVLFMANDACAVQCWNEQESLGRSPVQRLVCVVNPINDRVNTTGDTFSAAVSKYFEPRGHGVSSFVF